VIRGLFFVLSTVLGLSTLGIVLEAVFSSGAYGCSPPPSILLMPPFAICGVICLALAPNRSERLRLAAVLAIGTLASVRVLSFPFGYRRNYEAGAIGDVRTVISGQAAYESVNGYYDTLECLTKPSSCIPGYPTTSPSFLNVELAQREHGQYRHWLVPGPPASDRPLSASRTSTRTYAYVAVPVDSRMRSFCADDTGVIFQAPDGITPSIRNAQCDDPRFKALK
jgi:hypothetical protein